MNEKTELIIIPNEPRSLFDPSAMDSILAEIEAKAKSIVTDISTDAGRKQVASLAYQIAKSKTALDDAGKNLVSGIKAEAKLIDDERKKARDFLDALKEEIRRPLTDFEDTEKARVSNLEIRLQRLESCCREIPSGSAAISELLERVKAVDPTSFQEFAARATATKQVAITTLGGALDLAIKQEQETAELEALRKEKLAREQKDREDAIAKEAADKARREAEDKAAREKAEIEAAAQAREKAIRDEAELKERQAKEAAEKIQRDQAKAELERLNALEVERIADEKRAANKKHREKVISAAVHALTESGVDPDSASHAVELITEGKVPAVSIQF